MTESSSEANEADRLDQQTPIYGAEIGEIDSGISEVDADEADVADQRRDAKSAEDDDPYRVEEPE